MVDAAGCTGGERSGREGVDTDALFAQLGSSVAHGAFERRLDGPHDVVVPHHARRAEKRDGQTGPALGHQRLGQPDHAQEGVHGNVHGLCKAFGRAVDDAAVQVLPGSEGDGVHEGIEPSPGVGDAVEEGFHLAGLGHIERADDRGLQLGGQRFDIGTGLVVEPGDGHLGSLRTQGLGTAPGDRMFVCHADNQRLLSAQRKHAYPFQCDSSLMLHGGCVKAVKAVVAMMQALAAALARRETACISQQAKKECPPGQTRAGCSFRTARAGIPAPGGLCLHLSRAAGWLRPV